MKRVLSLLLTAVLLSALCLPAHADGEEEPNRRVSEYCEAASMSDYRELFRDAESGGMDRDMTRAMLAGILYNIFGQRGGRGNDPLGRGRFPVVRRRNGVGAEEKHHPERRRRYIQPRYADHARGVSHHALPLR